MLKEASKVAPVDKDAKETRGDDKDKKPGT